MLAFSQVVRLEACQQAVDDPSVNKSRPTVVQLQKCSRIFYMWIIKELDTLIHIPYKDISTWDLYSSYTTISHTDLVDRISSLIAPVLN